MERYVSYILLILSYINAPNLTKKRMVHIDLLVEYHFPESPLNSALYNTGYSELARVAEHRK